ncbi:CCA tRNA nucleotidyltransferase [Paenirhodobacter enshiensis]|uniref:CCA tRNA nucleotidyltransferase n=1 Tax=Paenirhodobacter enshiensis TaxID=1105367 RepID=UPI0035B0C84A
MKIAADWLTSASVQQVLGMLSGAGYRGFLVGGCVRNALLGRPVADIDIATDALPETVAALAGAAGLKSVPTGIEHGTVTVIAGGAPHEVTTFRRDTHTDGRHATVAFTTDIAEDAARRDFTMNALYAAADGTVLDPVGTGLADLAAGRVRFVGEPERRIREDYLRILRFFRFSALYGDPGLGLDAGGLAACAALADGIDGLSRERIGHEMRRLLDAPDPAPAVAAMRAAGVLAHVLPGADDRSLPVLVHLEDGQAPDWLCRLAVLGGEDAADALRLSRAEARDLARLRQAALEGGDPAVLGYRLGARIGAAAVLTHAALSEMAPPAGWAGAVAFGARQRFPLRAADLPEGVVGPEIGRRLRALEERWIASGFRAGRDDLLG